VSKIDGLIAGLTDWRGPTLANLRRIIHAADPGNGNGEALRSFPITESSVLPTLSRTR